MNTTTKSLKQPSRKRSATITIPLEEWTKLKKQVELNFASERYKRAIKNFSEAMLYELMSNHPSKGNFLEWKPCRKAAWKEFSHHAKKLEKALKRDGNENQITEYAADISNIMMAIHRSCGDEFC